METNTIENALNTKPITKSAFNDTQLTAIENNGGMRLALNNFAEIEKFANLMAISNFVPKHLRTKPADCLAVLLQSLRWSMDPFAVAGKTYFVNDGIGYEAQLVNAIIISKAPINSRPEIKWDGEGDKLECTVSATFRGEKEPKSRTAKFATITTKNSPLWKQDPQQQLAYYTLRAWARLYCPDVLLGVYTKEEREEMKDVTPQSNTVLNNLNSAIRRETTVTDIEESIVPEEAITGEIVTENSNASVSATEQTPRFLRKRAS